MLVIRNQRDGTITPVPEIPSTGQLWWPVPLLVLMGIMCVIIGLVRRREDYYEE